MADASNPQVPGWKSFSIDHSFNAYLILPLWQVVLPTPEKE